MFVNLKNIIEFCKIKKERIKHIIKFHEINFNLMIMRKILLPYAKDESGSLVSIKDASRSGKYTCPECGGELSLRKVKYLKAKSIIKEIISLIKVELKEDARNPFCIGSSKKNVLNILRIK